MRRLAPLLLLAACGEPPATPPPPDTTPPVTTLSPGPGTYAGTTAVTLSADEPAAIAWTLDGTDPALPGARSGPSPQTATLEGPAKLLLRYFATDAAGNREAPREASYRVVRPGLAPASITGTIFAVDALRAGRVAVALLDEDPAQPGGPTHEPLRYATLGSIPTGNMPYLFENLPAGRYWVLGVWAPPAGDAELYVAARPAPVELDPADPAKARADFVDVRFGSCDPQGTGVDGEVVLPERLRSRSVFVGAYAGPVRFDGMPEARAMSAAPGTGERRPFALCDLPPQPAWLVGYAIAPGAQDADAIVAWHANPADPSGLVHATLWLEAQAPELGSVSGTVRLSAPLPGGHVALVLSDEAFAAGMAVQRLSRLPASAAGTDTAYALASVAPGTWHLLASVEAADGRQTWAFHPDDVELTAAARHAVVDLEVGVGRLSGRIQVRHAPAGERRAAMLAARPGHVTEAYETCPLGPAEADGTRRATCELFGLADGTYTTSALVDVDGDSDFEDDFNLGHYAAGTPAVTTVAGGVGPAVDFVLDAAP